MISVPEKNTLKRDSVFLPLFFLTGFFLLLEISFFIQCNKMYLADFSSVSDALAIPYTILPGVFYFLGAQLLVHVSYSFLIGCIALLAAKSIKLAENKKAYFAMIMWGWGLVTALVANQYYYPHSKFSDLTSLLLVNQFVAMVLLIILLIPCGIIIFLALTELVKLMVSKYLYLGLATLALTLSLIFFFQSKPLPIIDAATEERPNIILIGVDSLRPDFLSYFGHNNPTPFFDRFVAGASMFNEAVTPLARTFPAWTSILTGLYPRETGIRSILSSQKNLNLTNTLPAILQRHGYSTLYATDETRFSNIDKRFGFDTIITPPMGLNDFLLGTFNDFPLSNLLVNTRVGQWLFPYSYANRPVYFTYNPDTFIDLLRPALQEKRDKPLFLTVHFCLAHHPYLWANSPGEEVNVLQRYEASLVRVDKQVQDFFALLKDSHLLDRAIVVLLSDHGEAFELHGDRITDEALFVAGKKTKSAIPSFYPPGLDNEEVDQSVGHGTDVLGLTQYYSLLAFKLYGLGPQEERVVPGVVSLLDIKPTILDLLGLEKETGLAGTSLATIIKGESEKVSHRQHIFLESDFSPASIRTVYPEAHQVVLEGVQLFEVDALTTRLTLKDAMSTMIIKSKQYADIYGEWMLALYPQQNNTHTPILINLVSGEWTNDLQSNFALNSPASHMLTALKTFYGNEINKV